MKITDAEVGKLFSEWMRLQDAADRYPTDSELSGLAEAARLDYMKLSDAYAEQCQKELEEYEHRQALADCRADFRAASNRTHGNW